VPLGPSGGLQLELPPADVNGGFRDSDRAQVSAIILEAVPSPGPSGGLQLELPPADVNGGFRDVVGGGLVLEELETVGLPCLFGLHILCLQADGSEGDQTTVLHFHEQALPAAEEPRRKRAAAQAKGKHTKCVPKLKRVRQTKDRQPKVGVSSVSSSATSGCLPCVSSSEFVLCVCVFVCMCTC
jgi:hypothetical protein